MAPWPNGAKAAISFTMDNLGEAQDVNKNLWPADQPIGSHFSVLKNLPRMLDLLDRHGIKATFFAESWSLDVYPHAVKEMLSRGHELAWHGFQHEVWSSLSEAAEEENFARSFAKADEHGIAYQGFRPPGGTINDRTWALFRRYGVDYVSPLGEFGMQAGAVVLPFEWRGVDAFYYMDKFAGIRESHGEPKEVLRSEDFEGFLMKKIEETIGTGGYMSVLFHPFLTDDEERLAVMERVVTRMASDGSIWCAPCGDVSRWVSDHRSEFGFAE